MPCLTALTVAALLLPRRAATAVVELIRQAVARGERVLASAASNIAVDNMAERLLSGGGAAAKALRIVRIGHPARLLPSVLEASLDAVCKPRLDPTSTGHATPCPAHRYPLPCPLLPLFATRRLAHCCALGSRSPHPAIALSQTTSAQRLASSDGGAIVRDVRADLERAREQLRREKAKGGRAALKAEVGTLRRELTQRQQRSVRDLLMSSHVVLCTNTGAADRALRCLPETFSFDLVVIDEAAQALEASCWVALLKGARCVLAGDHLQLPPVVKSAQAEVRISRVLGSADGGESFHPPTPLGFCQTLSLFCILGTNVG